MHLMAVWAYTASTLSSKHQVFIVQAFDEHQLSIKRAMNGLFIFIWGLGLWRSLYQVSIKYSLCKHFLSIK